MYIHSTKYLFVDIMDPTKDYSNELPEYNKPFYFFIKNKYGAGSNPHWNYINYYVRDLLMKKVYSDNNLIERDLNMELPKPTRQYMVDLETKFRGLYIIPEGRYLYEDLMDKTNMGQYTTSPEEVFKLLSSFGYTKKQSPVPPGPGPSPPGPIPPRRQDRLGDNIDSIDSNAIGITNGEQTFIKPAVTNPSDININGLSQQYRTSSDNDVITNIQPQTVSEYYQYIEQNVPVRQFRIDYHEWAKQAKLKFPIQNLDDKYYYDAVWDASEKFMNHNINSKEYIYPAMRAILKSLDKSDPSGGDDKFPWEYSNRERKTKEAQTRAIARAKAVDYRADNPELVPLLMKIPYWVRYALLAGGPLLLLYHFGYEYVEPYVKTNAMKYTLTELGEIIGNENPNLPILSQQIHGYKPLAIDTAGRQVARLPAEYKSKVEPTSTTELKGTKKLLDDIKRDKRELGYRRPTTWRTTNDKMIFDMNTQFKEYAERYQKNQEIEKKDIQTTIKKNQIATKEVINKFGDIMKKKFNKQKEVMQEVANVAGVDTKIARKYIDPRGPIQSIISGPNKFRGPTQEEIDIKDEELIKTITADDATDLTPEGTKLYKSKAGFVAALPNKQIIYFNQFGFTQTRRLLGEKTSAYIYFGKNGQIYTTGERDEIPKDSIFGDFAPTRVEIPQITTTTGAQIESISSKEPVQDGTPLLMAKKPVYVKIDELNDNKVKLTFDEVKDAITTENTDHGLQYMNKQPNVELDIVDQGLQYMNPEPDIEMEKTDDFANEEILELITNPKPDIAHPFEIASKVSSDDEEAIEQVNESIIQKESLLTKVSGYIGAIMKSSIDAMKNWLNKAVEPLVTGPLESFIFYLFDINIEFELIMFRRYLRL